MPAEWDPHTCNEKSGFLFKHHCKNKVDQRCELCKKPVCNDHLNQVDDKLACTTCTKAHVREQEQGARAASPGGRGRSRYYYDDDPYFYSYNYYPGYGHYHSGWGRSHYHSSHYHDRNDFTEADSESLQQEGDDSWEDDLDES